jgi:hypothetical protein
MELVFVYNADDGAVSAVFDLAHKIKDPDSYQCNVCKLTHGNFFERNQWKHFKEKSSVNMRFMHRDEFEQQYGNKFSYPVVLKKHEGLDVLITTDELNSLTSPEELIACITKRISSPQQ